GVNVIVASSWLTARTENFTGNELKFGRNYQSLESRSYRQTHAINQTFCLISSNLECSNAQVNICTRMIRISTCGVNHVRKSRSNISSLWPTQKRMLC